MTFGSIGRLACVSALSFGSAAPLFADEDAIAQLRDENMRLADLALERQREIVQLKARVEDLQQQLRDAKTGPAPSTPTITPTPGGAVGTATREQELIRRVKELQEENRRLQESANRPMPTTSRPTVRVEADTPKETPRPEISGTVVDVASDAAFATIDIGSDAGVRSGSELDVYRLDLQNVRNSRYLGRLKIVKVESNRAVGSVVPLPGAKPEVRSGDRVGLIQVDLASDD